MSGINIWKATMVFFASLMRMAEVLYYTEQPTGFDSNQKRMVSQWMK
jgi:hypothetical protein